jgi:hypothetical protein
MHVHASERLAARPLVFWWQRIWNIRVDVLIKVCGIRSESDGRQGLYWLVEIVGGRVSGSDGWEVTDWTRAAGAARHPGI